MRHRGEVGEDPKWRRNREPCSDRIVERGERDVAAERPAREDQRDRRRGSRELGGECGDGRLRVELLAVPVAVRALTAFHAPEVEAQTRDTNMGERLEERADHDRAHRAAVLGMRVTQHHRRTRRGIRGRELGFEREAVARGDDPRLDHRSVTPTTRADRAGTPARRLRRARRRSGRTDPSVRRPAPS